MLPVARNPIVAMPAADPERPRWLITERERERQRKLRAVKARAARLGDQDDVDTGGPPPRIEDAVALFDGREEILRLGG